MLPGCAGFPLFVVIGGCTGLAQSTEIDPPAPDAGFGSDSPIADGGSFDALPKASDALPDGSEEMPPADAPSDTGGDVDVAALIDAPSVPRECPPSLGDRLSVSRMSVAPLTANAGYPVTIVDRGDRLVVAWTDRVEGGGGRARISVLSPSFARMGADIVLEGDAAESLVVDETGYTVLVRREGPSLATVKVTPGGAVLFDRHRIGDADHDTVGSSWVAGISHMTAIPDGVAVYSPIYRRSSDGLAHQGDMLRFYDNEGRALSGGWGWGCSHSLSQRLAYNGTRLAAICLSDCYPSKAILLDRTTSIASEPSGNCAGSSDARLGDLVAVSDGFWLTYTSRVERASSDVVITHITNAGAPMEKRFLTNTDADETAAHLTAYGDGILVGWREVVSPPAYYLLAVKTDGHPHGHAEAIASTFPDSRDFFTFADGDAGWAQASNDGAALVMTRVDACQ